MASKPSTKTNSSTRFLKNLYRKTIYLLVIVAAIFFVITLLYDKITMLNFIQAQVEQISKKTGFVIEEITMTNNNEYCPIATATLFDEYKGQAILLAPLEKIQERLESLDCVKSANISRNMPNKIKIEVIDQEPIAIWQHKKGFFFITAQNKLMKIRDATNLTNFVIVTGDNAYTHATTLMEMISIDQNILAQIDAAMRVGDRRWDIRLKNGLEIKLPEKHPELAWSKFVQLQNTATEFQENKFKVIDLRIPDKIYTR